MSSLRNWRFLLDACYHFMARPVTSQTPAQSATNAQSRVVFARYRHWQPFSRIVWQLSEGGCDEEAAVEAIGSAPGLPKSERPALVLIQENSARTRCTERRLC